MVLEVSSSRSVRWDGDISTVNWKLLARLVGYKSTGVEIGFRARYNEALPELRSHEQNAEVVR
jgi:hypothetical protein